MLHDVNAIYAYIDKYGRSPYSLWLNIIRDPKAKAAIISRVDRMATIQTSTKK